MAANLPVTQFLAMALAAKPVRFGKGEALPGGQPQAVPVLRMVTVQAPELSCGMPRDNSGMLILKFPALEVGFHLGVAVGAGEDPLGEGGGGDRNANDRCRQIFGDGLLA